MKPLIQILPRTRGFKQQGAGRADAQPLHLGEEARLSEGEQGLPPRAVPIRLHAHGADEGEVCSPEEALAETIQEIVQMQEGVRVAIKPVAKGQTREVEGAPGADSLGVVGHDQLAEDTILPMTEGSSGSSNVAQGGEQRAAEIEANPFNLKVEMSCGPGSQSMYSVGESGPQ